jgi:hypothetical protein
MARSRATYDASALFPALVLAGCDVDRDGEPLRSAGVNALAGNRQSIGRRLARLPASIPRVAAAIPACAAWNCARP